jgi:hypothetical protein
VPAVETIKLINPARGGGSGGEGDGEDGDGGVADGEVVVGGTGAEVNIFSVSSEDVQFHPAVFKPQVVAPGSSVTIQIIFLPRDRGLVDSKLLIETEAGAFTFPVRGLGTENPYKLTGFVGARVPIGVLYNPPIRIYNPFPTVRGEAKRRRDEETVHRQLENREQRNHQRIEIREQRI